MIGIRLYIALAAIVAALAAVGLVWHTIGQNHLLEAQLRDAKAQIENASRQAQQARHAQAVAEAESARLAKAAKEYNDLREWVIRNDDKAPIPPLLRAAIDRMFRERGAR